MNQLWQIFVAPENESKSLSIESSPWHEDRDVKIPRRHWELIIDYAKSIDTNLAQKLDFYSFATQSDDENDYVYIDFQELEKLVEFIAKLRQIIQDSKPIHPEATEELPDLYENSEYARMLEAVSAVFQESLNINEPFRAWIE